MSSEFDLNKAVEVDDKRKVIEFFKLKRNSRKRLITYLEGLGKAIPEFNGKKLADQIEELCEKNFPEVKTLYQWTLALQDVSINYLKDLTDNEYALAEKVSDLTSKDQIIIEFLIMGFDMLLIDAFRYGKLESFDKDTGTNIQTTMNDWLDKRYETDTELKDMIQDMFDSNYAKKNKRFVVEHLKRDEDGSTRISFIHETGDKWVQQLPDKGGSHWDRPAKADVIRIDPKNKKIVTTYKHSKRFLQDIITSIKRTDVDVELKEEEYSFEETGEAITIPDVEEETIRNIRELLKEKTLCAIEYKNLNAEGNPSKIIIEGDDVGKFLKHLNKQGIALDDWVDENNVCKTFSLPDGRKFLLSKNKLNPLSRKFTKEEKMILKELFSG